MTVVTIIKVITIITVMKIMTIIIMTVITFIVIMTICYSDNYNNPYLPILEISFQVIRVKNSMLRIV